VLDNLETLDNLSKLTNVRSLPRQSSTLKRTDRKRIQIKQNRDIRAERNRKSKGGGK
jgi:hypothetical protein